MGSSIEIGSNLPIPKEIIFQAFELCHDDESLLSNYLDTSEVTRLNNLQLGEKATISKRLLHFLFMADRFNRKYPQFNIFYKFPGTGIHSFRHVGKQTYEKVQDVYIDTGGLGKGYTVDRISKYLSEKGYGNHSINFGSSSIKISGNLVKSLFVQELDKIIKLPENACFSGSSTRNKFHIYSGKTGKTLNRRSFAYAIKQTCSEAEAASKDSLF